MQVISKEEIERFGKFGIIAVSGYQWYPKNEFSYPVEVKYLGEKCAEVGYSAKPFVNAGALVAAHTEYLISPAVSAPIAGICKCNKSESTFWRNEYEKYR